MDVTARADLKLFPDAGERQRLCHGRPELVRSQRHRHRTLEHGTAYLDPQGSAT